MRVGYLLSAAMPGVIPRLKWVAVGDGGLELRLPADLAGLYGDRPSWRLEQLARMIERPLRLAVAPQ